MRKIVKSVLGLGILAIGLVSVPAYALTVVPTDADYSFTQNGNCDTACVEGITSLTGLTEQYKQNSGVGGTESGVLAGSYTTTFTTNAKGEFIGFQITYDGGEAVVCPTCVLYVKDGSPNPQYLFVTKLNNWNGTETITGSGFYAGDTSIGKGSISHVSIFSNQDPKTPPVPEPSTLLLLGTGLVGLCYMSRRSQKADSLSL